MVRLLIGCLSNGAMVVVGYLLVGFLAVSFVRSAAHEASGTDTFMFLYNAVTFVGVALVALGAAAVNIRITPAGTLRPVTLAVVAFAIPVIVVALLTVDYIRTYDDPQYVVFLITTVAVGAALGSALASGAFAAIRNRAR